MIRLENVRRPRSALLLGVAAAAVSIASPTFAQEAAEGAAAEAEGTVSESVIIVTGSRIANPNLEQSAPIAVVSSDEIELQQANNAEELMRDLPGAIANMGSSVNNGNPGASFVDLRGLGANRNVVLLDGARIVPALLVGVTDLNNVPLALIDRIDVLTGGASTTYGADAVSGVVNFITKKDFEGAELAVSKQITEKGDGDVFRADLTLGASFDDARGNAVLSIGYQTADAVYQGDRAFSREALSSTTGNPQGSTAAVPGRFSRPGSSTQQIDTATGALVPGYSTFNFNPYNIFQTPFERFNLFGAAHYEVAGGIEAYAQAMFSKNRVSTIAAASGAFQSPIVVPVSNPFLPAAARSQFCAANGISVADCAAAALATDPNDPNYRTFSTLASRRFVEGATRDRTFTTTLFNVRAGVRGDITDTLKFDVYGTYGESESIRRQTGNGLLSRLQQAMLATNADTCLDPTGGCVPMNLFGAEGSITPEMLAFLEAPATQSTFTSLGAVQGVISGDFGVASPFAETPIGIAVGAEYRRYTAFNASDVATQTPGEILGNGAPTPDAGGKYNVRELFGEVVAPLVEDKPFFQSLTLELGARYSKYSTTGGAFTYKLGGSWEPGGGAKFRASYNRATRSPNIGELYAPSVTGLDNLDDDPCQLALPVGNANLTAICIAQGAPASAIGNIQPPNSGQINVTGGGNPDLDVEKATTYTLGVVFQPDFVPGLALTLDYYDILVTDAISVPAVGDVLAQCFDPAFNPTLALTPACTENIRRNPVTGGLDGDLASTPGVLQPASNDGRIATNGIDFTANYRRELGFGILNVGFNANWTLSSKYQANPAAANRECVGYYSSNCAADGAFVIGSIQPKVTWNQRTTLSIEPFDISLMWRHIGAMKVEPGAGNYLPKFSSIDAYNYFDLSVRAEVHENLTVTLTMQNMFDKDPPVVGNTIGTTSFNSGNTYPSTYDALGRRFAIGASLAF